jgi:hypothetical protein
MEDRVERVQIKVELSVIGDVDVRNLELRIPRYAVQVFCRRRDIVRSIGIGHEQPANASMLDLVGAHLRAVA